MKQLFALFVALSLCTSTFASGSASVLPSSKPAPLNAAELFLPIGKEGMKISLLELSQIRVKDFEKISGRKLTFADKVKFRIGQSQLAKKINYDNTLNVKKLSSLKPSKKATERSRKYLRTCLILLLAAIVLALLALLIPFFGILSIVAGIGALIFFIMWIIE
jgi:hypothetical protein